MIKLIHLLTGNDRSSGMSKPDVEFCAALTHMQNALQVLERTLQSIDRELPESYRENAANQSQLS